MPKLEKQEEPVYHMKGWWNIKTLTFRFWVPGDWPDEPTEAWLKGLEESEELSRVRELLGTFNIEPVKVWEE